MKRDYTYNILSDNSPDVFKEVCKKIENNFPNAKKLKLAVDVDGSMVQVYQIGSKEIVVFDDYEVGAVYIESDIQLSDKITIIEFAA